MRLLRLAVFVGISAAFVSAPLLAKRPVTAEDYFRFQSIADVKLSPDGRQAAYVLTSVNEPRNRRENAIWLVATDGRTPPRKLSADGMNSTTPRWSPDGTTLAFLSSRATEGPPGNAGAPSSQIWLLFMNGGEAHVLTRLKNGVSAFQWSPDGQHFVAVSRVGPSDQYPAGFRRPDTRHYTHIRYKFNDTGWFDDRRMHLWVVDAQTGKDQQVTSGDDWNDTDPQWSPDGARIAFVSDRTGKEYDGGHDKDVFVIAAAGGAPVKISDHEFEDDQPRWSPDGKQIAFTGKIKRDLFPKIYIADATGGKPSKLIAPDLDLIPDNLKWIAPGEIRFDASYKGQFHMFRVDLASGKLAQVTSGDRSVHGFDVNQKAGVMAYLANDFEHMDDIRVAALDGSSERKITDVNSQLWEELDLTRVERMPYMSSDGWQVDGFLVKPINFNPSKKYPLILSIHGGPGGQYGTDWFHEAQVYASKGWAVFFCNPRGSTGYGQKFERGIKNNWGGMDYQDVMAGVDAAIKQNPWIDSATLGVTGGSYGGFMTNWIVSHTDRFKAAVTLRSISNFISDDGTRDGAYGHEEDFTGMVFEDFDQYWSASPLKYVKNVKTPILILHSDNDYRVPIEQGEQWFRALKYYGKEAEIVFFPRENHNLTRTGEPRHLVESLKWQTYWFDRYLEGKTDAKAPDTP
jgi:dipeptidyl aminopeptidase/acylaminoacyl peptidase